ncbi:MAG: hypothetical protein K6E35_04040 [Bacteroidales bacterium]|nr:hypothetical protein [Bacteroidales bacterium]
MRNRLRHLFVLTVLLVSTLSAFGQGKIYTRKMRLADFPTKTTKVVLEGNSFLELALREEIAVHWRISPFEFCSQNEYGQLRTSSNYYFLTLAQEEGLAYLTLTKGGKAGEKDQLKQAFEVVRMPLASVDNPTGRELVFMGAFLDIIQSFVEQAMISDKVAYGGLSTSNDIRLKGKTVYLDPDTADECYLREEADALLGITIAPEGVTFKTVCYKILISADTHELLYFDKNKYRGPADGRFTDNEARRFERRGATVVR